MRRRPPTRGHRSGRRRLGAFVARHGWRAYAVPILAVLTVAALLQPSPAHPERRAAPVAAVPVIHAQPSASASAAGAPEAAVPETIEQVALQDDSTVCLTNTASTFVLVNLHKQHVWMCQGHRQVYSTAATTGETDNGDQTPTGTWTVQGKQTDRYLVGPGYRDYVHYWIPFNGDFGFHDATWQKMAFGSPGYKSKGSHGCVHLPMTAVKWLYTWARTGSTRVTVEA